MCLLAPKAGATGPVKLDISYPTNEFTKITKGWEKYDGSKMNLAVRHIKQSVIKFLRLIKLSADDL